VAKCSHYRTCAQKCRLSPLHCSRWHFLSTFCQYFVCNLFFRPSTHIPRHLWIGADWGAWPGHRSSCPQYQPEGCWSPLRPSKTVGILAFCMTSLLPWFFFYGTLCSQCGRGLIILFTSLSVISPHAEEPWIVSVHKIVYCYWPSENFACKVFTVFHHYGYAQWLCSYSDFRPCSFCLFFFAVFSSQSHICCCVKTVTKSWTVSVLSLVRSVVFFSYTLNLQGGN
jgi:hypothetical protein